MRWVVGGSFAWLVVRFIDDVDVDDDIAAAVAAVVTTAAAAAVDVAVDAAGWQC